MSYTQYYELEKNASPIIGEGRNSHELFGQKPDLSNPQAIRRLMERYESPDGWLSQAEAEVREIETEFDNLRTQQAALGWQAPESMPPELADRYARTCARRDVRDEEYRRLGEIQDELHFQYRTDRRKKIERAIGRMQFATDYDEDRALTRTCCDRQFVALADDQGNIVNAAFNPRDKAHLADLPPNAVAIIDDPQSPYNGFSLGAYRQVVEWIKHQINQRKERLLAENASLPRDEQEPQTRIVDRARQWKPAQWPPEPPSDAVNYKKREAESESDS